MQELGYKQSSHEPCVYFKVTEDKIVIVGVYVDDFFIVSNDSREKKRLKDKLKSKFKIKDLGKVKHFLGLSIEKNEKTGEVFLHQKQYITEILKKFGMLESKLVTTPVDLGMKGAEDTSKKVTDVPYQNIIGSLMYLAVNTRPDLAFIVSFLSQYNVEHTEMKWKMLKRVLCYLNSTKNLGIMFKPTGEDVIGFVDADYGNDQEEGKLYTGYVFKYGGGPIAWESKKQRCTSMSSTESEYVAMSEAAKEAVHLQGFFTELLREKKTILIYNDNQSAQKLAHNPVFHKRVKHIKPKYHFIREQVQEGNIAIKYMCTEDMIADVLTKGLGRLKHQNCLRGIGMKDAA